MILFLHVQSKVRMDMFDGKIVSSPQLTNNVIDFEAQKWMRQYQQPEERSVIDAIDLRHKLISEGYHSTECASGIAYHSNECICRKDAGTPPLRLV